MQAFAWIEKLSGRSYSLFEYVGSKSAKYVLVIMGSGAGVVEEYLTKMGDKASAMEWSIHLTGDTYIIIYDNIPVCIYIYVCTKY